MTNQEKIELLADMLDVEASALSETTLLSDIEEYDSMAKLSLIVLCDEECGMECISSLFLLRRK